MIFSSSQVAAALGPRVPVQNIDANWPLVWTALDQCKIASRACEIAAIATIGVETGAFSPIKERGGPSYFIKLYWENQKKAVELGNTCAEDERNRVAADLAIHAGGIMLLPSRIFIGNADRKSAE